MFSHRFLPSGSGERHLPVPLGEVQGGEVAGGTDPLNQFVDPGHGVGVKVRDLIESPEVIA